jgi:peroxiredoxin (alkyl hydroperoxide reductase subunit C)
MEDNQVVSMPRIGDKAPEFKALTTQEPIIFPADYSGNWVILFSHPADFTPVCTSEFMTFASMEKQFAQAGCKLVGLSVDGLYSHIAWLCTIKEKIEYKGMKNVEVNFPLIEDIKMEVARKYGMLQPGDDVIVPTAGSCGVAKERMEKKEEMQCYDWFFCTKKLPKETILKTILKN